MQRVILVIYSIHSTDESSVVTIGIVTFVLPGAQTPCNSITTLIGQIKPSTIFCLQQKCGKRDAIQEQTSLATLRCTPHPLPLRCCITDIRRYILS